MELVSIFTAVDNFVSVLHDSLKPRAPRRLCSPAPRLLQVPSLFHDSFQRGECVCRTLVPSCPKSECGRIQHWIFTSFEPRASMSPRRPAFLLRFFTSDSRKSCLSPRTIYAEQQRRTSAKPCHLGLLAATSWKFQRRASETCMDTLARKRPIWDFSRQRAGQFSVARVRQITPLQITVFVGMKERTDPCPCSGALQQWESQAS